jgi:hypothetical protein
MTDGAVDMALVWERLSASERQQIKAAYTAAGISLMVSAFGSTDAPTSAGADPIALANKMAAWVKKYDLDGIDVDYEDFGAVGSSISRTAQWLADFTTQLRKQLPAGQYFLTHAPVAPWFSEADGVYRLMDQKAGNAVDWYNVQFYNQGTSEYADCNGLFERSSAAWPHTSVFELSSKFGIPLNKIVVGKPGRQDDAANGYLSTADLAKCAAAGAKKGWTGGIMVWQYRPGQIDSNWINAVRKTVWPLGGVIPVITSQETIKTSSTVKSSSTKEAPTTSSTVSVDVPTSTPTSVETSSTKTSTKTASVKTSLNPTVIATKTTISSSAAATEAQIEIPEGPEHESPETEAPTSCGTATAWKPETTYWAHDTVSFNGSTFTAKWWTVGSKPSESGKWDVWAAAAKCDSEGEKKVNPVAKGGKRNAEWDTAILQAAATRKMVRSHKRSHH